MLPAADLGDSDLAEATARVRKAAQDSTTAEKDAEPWSWSSTVMLGVMRTFGWGVDVALSSGPSTFWLPLSTIDARFCC